MQDGSPRGGAKDDARFLRLDRLTKRFGDVAAVDAISIDIPKGQIFALLGSSGCGKSTLLRMLAGFETPTEGQIVLEGVDIAAMPAYERPINMMFQSYALFPHMTVWDNIAFGLRRQKVGGTALSERVERMLTLVQLKPYAKRKPHQLSGGQQQRVALARSLALEPRLLLLDEPLGALDRKLREQTQFELQTIIKEVGVTCVMVTHDQEEAMTMADRIAIMSKGRFMQVGTPSEIYETPNCRFVADFIGKANLFTGVLEIDAADHCIIQTALGKFLVGHGITGVAGMELCLAVRPEKINLASAPPEDVRYNYLPGTVLERAYFGSSSLYRVKLASGERLQVTVPSTDRHAELLAIGEPVHASFAPDSIVVLTT